MPLTVGGGVREVEDFARLLERGADKVCINTVAFEKPELVSEAAARASARSASSCRSISAPTQRAAPSCIPAMPACRRHVDVVESCGAGRRSGRGRDPADRCGPRRHGRGPQLPTVAGRLLMPVSSRSSFRAAAASRSTSSKDSAGGAEAVAAGTFFCFRDQNPMQTRAHIRNAGIPIRIGDLMGSNRHSPGVRTRRAVPARAGAVTDEYVGWLRDPEVNRYLESRFAAHDLASTTGVRREDARGCRTRSCWASEVSNWTRTSATSSSARSTAIMDWGRSA